jgi:hypothetical protein
VLSIIRAVGLKAPSDKNDVTFIQRRLIEIKKLKKPAPTGSMDDATLEAIWDFQDHFMLTPDGVISPNGPSVRFLNSWSEKTIGHGVNLSVGKLREAWNLVNPLLPSHSYCSSGFRSADEQRRLLQGRFKTFKNEIVAKYGAQKYDASAQDLLKNEKDRGCPKIGAWNGSVPSSLQALALLPRATAPVRIAHSPNFTSKRRPRLRSRPRGEVLAQAHKPK